METASTLITDTTGKARNHIEFWRVELEPGIIVCLETLSARRNIIIVDEPLLRPPVDLVPVLLPMQLPKELLGEEEEREGNTTTAAPHQGQARVARIEIATRRLQLVLSEVLPLSD